ncbi:MAG: ABC transporter permease [Clostridiaceae bacterium]|jgi:cell division transport system permease protein|nr:ABC transporter permease [Clostridiaceae bacterium]
MKIRTIKYLLKEGISNTYKNLLMSLASLAMVISSLLIFGVFLMITINLFYNYNRLESQFEIVVILETDATSFEASDIEQKIISDERVFSYKRVSKEEAFSEMKEMLEDSELITGLTPEFLYESFRIHLKDADQSEAFVEELSVMPGIKEMEFPRELLEKLGVFFRWMNVGSMFVLTLLLIISVSIISNTIKLTVYARRREIGIMKYIGANDWFIRWPFIIEGMVIGLVGAVISFILTSYGYNAIESYVNRELISGSLEVLRVKSLDNISARLLLLYVIIGTVMGAIGSIISVRKHLNV